MKNKMRYLFILSVCLGFASCTDDLVSEVTSIDETAGTESYVKYITATIEPFGEIYDQASTRGNFVIENGTFKDLWAQGDTIGIFPSKGGQVEFPLTEYGTLSANFDGGGWALKPSYTYSAYFPFSKWNVFKDNKTIPIEYDYSKMTQTANGSTAHLGAFDFMASDATTKSESGGLTFTMKRLSSVLWFDLTVPVTDTFTELQLTSNKYSFTTAATLNISGAEPVISSKNTTRTISLKLNNIAVTARNKLTAYMLVLPTALKTSGCTLTLTLKGKNYTFTTTITPVKDLVRNEGWKISKTLEYYLNPTLVAKAEASNTGVTFTKNADGKYSLSDNMMQIINVRNLDLSGVTDSEVYAQLSFLTGLQELKCSGNNLTSLDVSSNPVLTTLDCSNNNLTSLDVSANTQLKILKCSNNKLTSLSLTKNTALLELDCSKNSLSSLTLTYNTALLNLYCNNNSLSSLSLTKNTNLGVLVCNDNKLQSLNVTYNTLLEYIYCQNNQLTTLTGLGLDKTKVKWLFAGGNKFTSLNFESSASTFYLPYLQQLDLSNSTYLEKLFLRSFSDQGQVGKLTGLDVTGCTALTVLRVDGHKLTGLSTSTNTALYTLTCSDNLITNLDLSNNKELTVLDCYSNLMSVLIVTQNTKLLKSNIHCGNQFTNSNKTTSKTLYLYARSNDTTSLDNSFGTNNNVVLQ